MTTRGFEHVQIFNAPKNIDSGHTILNSASLFLGDSKQNITMTGMARSQWSHWDCGPDAQLLCKWHLSNLSVKRQCHFITWRLAEILIGRRNVRNVRELKHFDIRYEDIGPQLLSRGIGLVSCDENEPSCDNRQKNRCDASNCSVVSIQPTANPVNHRLSPLEDGTAQAGEAFCFAVFVAITLVLFVGRGRPH